MRLERTKNAKRNILLGTVSKIISYLLVFVIRIMIIRWLGAEYLGLDSLFASVLQVLNLSEMGISSAIIYCMYKPIANDDRETLSSLLAFYRKVYLCIGAFILAVGLMLMPFLSFFIKGDVPSAINIKYLYLIYLANSVVSYGFFAYKNALLYAYQRMDIVSIVNSIVKISMSLLQIIVLIITGNYYYFAMVYILSTIVNNCMVAYMAEHFFPDIMTKGVINEPVKKDIFTKVKGLLLNKICQVSRNAFDSVLVSMYLGLVQTAIYNNYFFVMNAINVLLTTVNSSIISGIGNSIVLDDQKKNYDDMKKINFIYMWISGMCAVGMLGVYQSFMAFFYGENMLFSYGVVILFSVYFYVLKMGDIRAAYSEAKGLWWENRYRAVTEAVANLILNIVLGRFFGVTGIIAATLISLFVFNFLWGSNIIYRHYFTEINIKEYYMHHLLYASVTILAGAVCGFVCSKIHWFGVPDMIIKGAICVTVSNIIYFVIYRNTKIYKEAMPWFLRVVNLNRGLLSQKDKL